MTIFLEETLLAKAKRYANDDLRGIATMDQMTWLRANPLLWLRGLSQMERIINNSIAKTRLDLARLKPGLGEAASGEYLKLKAEVGETTQKRLHFKGKVEERMEEVKSILGPDKIDRVMVGDLIQAFLSISYSADTGELEAAADQAMFWAKALATRSSKEREAAA